MLHESARTYDAGVRFGPVQMALPTHCPADWLGEQIEQALQLAHMMELTDRPLHISAPCTALTHPETLQRALRAVHARQACPQEICLEFDNASLSADLASALAGVRTLRSKGFRIGLNALRSSCALANPALLLLIDVAHVDAGELGYDLRLARRVKTAHEEGVQIIAHGAAWRDGDQLLLAGVDQVVGARADA